MSTKSSSSAPIAVAIMAAGKGTRLKSKRPKVLHEVGGRPLLEHVIRAAATLVPPQRIFTIIGHEADSVAAAVQHCGVSFVIQAEQRGDRKSTRLNSSHIQKSRMPSSA